MNKEIKKYRMICTLTFGDIYGQIIVWLFVIFLSLATALALWSSTREIYALAILLFAFVTTLFNKIEFAPIEAESTSSKSSTQSENKSTNKPAEATS